MLKNIKEKIFSLHQQELDLETRLSRMIISCGIIAAVLGLIVCCMAGVPAFPKILIVVIAIGAALALICNFNGVHEETASVILILGVVVIIPLLWLTAGGMGSGMSLWFVFEFVFLCMVSKGKALRNGLILAGILTSGCFHIAKYHPEKLFDLGSLNAQYASTAGSCVIICAVTSACILHQKKLYEQERKRSLEAEENLRKANELQKNFLANMSHEIRSPLNAVLGFNDLISQAESLDEVVDYSRHVKNSGQALLAIINDILDISKVEAGKLEIHEREYRFSDLKETCIDSVKTAAENKGLTFKVHAESDIPEYLYGDIDRLRQCIVNVLTNAVKYTEHGSVELYFSLNGYTKDWKPLLKVEIKDTGKGITEQQKEKLFTRFQRLDEKGSNRGIEGTGLGLALTKKLLDEMNGSIGVESEIGKGSVFVITVPQKVTKGYISQFVKDDSEKKKEVNLDGMRILVVDDTEINLVLMQKLLSLEGAIPEIAGSGAEAIELCKEDKYDLILMDHMMPKMDGVECFKHIRAEGKNTKTKVIVLTANATAGIADEYRALGFDGYVSKPVNMNNLKTELEKVY